AVHYRGDIASTGVIRDVTEERRQQAALEDAERRYRELFERSPAGLFRCRLDGSTVEVNPQLARLLGYATPDDCRREASIPDFFVDREEPARVLSRVLEQGGVDEYETWLAKRDGGRLWVSVSVRLLQGEEGA